MSGLSKIQYHLEELKIARDPSSPAHSMPQFYDTDKVILDIGCGIGQIYAASEFKNKKMLVGIDLDIESLAYGRNHFSYINYVNGSAQCMPFKDEVFDLVIGRVVLPYTNISEALFEVRRILKKGGRVWFTLHSFAKVADRLRYSAGKFRVKDVIFQLYVLVNGLLFHFSGKLFPFIKSGRIESFQTKFRIFRLLNSLGFQEIEMTQEKGFVVSAVKLS